MLLDPSRVCRDYPWVEMTTCAVSCARWSDGMPTIRLTTYIEASVERCFDISLNVDLHRRSVAHTRERPVAGVMRGTMKLGDTVTWEAIHFGVKQHLTTQITSYDRPHSFTDEMIRGVFHSMKHIHEFAP